jgi:hypothetical protein
MSYLKMDAVGSYVTLASKLLGIASQKPVIVMLKWIAGTVFYGL